jgi:hypothetical protein
MVFLDTPRILTYHPDFMGDDRWVATFHLPDRMDVALPESIEVSNAFGTYSLQCVMTKERRLQITSVLSVYRSLVAKENIDQVIEIYAAVQRGKALQLRWKNDEVEQSETPDPAQLKPMPEMR